MVELNTKIKVIVDEEFQDKVKFLCSNIPKVEWSGVLFYQVVGSIKDPNTMELHCKDIFLMDKGSQAYTEYAYSEDVVSYRMDNPESLDWLIGHIHSHNTMRTFFSGTDKEELEDNSPNHNFYFSLIVNNYMDMTAKVSFVGETEITSPGYKCKDEAGNEYILGQEETIRRRVLFVYDCDIHQPYSEISVPKSFSERYLEIEREYAFKEQQRRELAKKEQLNFSPKVVVGGGAAYFPNKQKTIAQALIESEEEPQTDIELFLAYVLRLGNLIEGDTLDEAIEDMKVSNIDETIFIGSIVENFPNYFDTYFDNLQHEDVAQLFLKTLEECIEVLEDYQIAFDGLEGLIEGLKMLGNQFEHLNKK